MQSIASLLLFHTPFEDKNIIVERFHKTKEMFQDYVVNAWIPLEKNHMFDGIYDIFEYKNTDFDIEISFSYKKDFEKNILFPSVIVDYKMNIFKFEKQNIESFLNDNILFFANVFWDDFFLDFDEKYSLQERSKWKKVEMKHLKKFDMQNKNAPENKQLLDSMMFLHFQLLKNIYELDNSSKNLTQLIEEQQSFAHQGKMFEIRQSSLKQDLISAQEKLKWQIETFLDLFNS